MAAPTQQLPSWLSASAVVVDGITETTIVYVPLTYFGPSIPLGTLFTFGGSTSPASTSITATPTSSFPSSSSPTSSATLASSSIPSSTLASSSSLQSSSSVSSTSSISVSASTTPTTQSHGLEKGQLIGVIIASVLGFIFLFVLALLLYLWCNARRNRKNRDRFSAVPPLDDDDYIIVPVGGASPGEGSPRTSGEEADPFLQRQPEMQQTSSIAGPSTVVAVGSRHPPSADNSISSSGKTSSNSAASGYGTLLQNPSLGVFAPVSEERHGNILSPQELRQFDDIPSEPQSRLSTVGEQGELIPLAPPPRLVDASRSQNRLDRMPSLASQTSDPDEATLLTARRIKAQDLGPRSNPLSQAAQPTSNQRESGVWKGLGLGGLAALGRLSFLQSITGSSSSRRNSHTSTSLLTSGLMDRDVEAGRALLNAEPGTPPDMAEAQGPRFRGQLGLGVGYGGDRPVSGTSANSRTSTIYHDAQSSLPGTPLVMPPPRALANSSSAELGYWPQIGTETTSSTTAAQERSQDGRSGTQSTSTSNGNLTTSLDVLDMPAPRSISPFASSGSLRDAGTTSSQGIQRKPNFPYPPGLTAFLTPSIWNETDTMTPSPGSFAAASLLPLPIGNADSGISIDVLEEEPPSPGDTWRSLTSGNIGRRGARRTTFGLPQLVHPPEFTSEQGSLHSMRSHLSPMNSRSTGSASVSRREQSGSSGSASSRPSARSVVSGSDGSASLAHSGSISSDERRRNRVQVSMSPSLSVFGNVSPPVSNSGHSQYPFLLSSPLLADSANKSSTDVISSSIAETAVVGDSSPEVKAQTTLSSPRSPLSSLSWAGGLGDTWSPS